ncbi:MAG: thioredoxin family protein [Fusobacteriaceae bacterium]
MFELDKDIFDTHVIESKELVLVDYFSNGCVPCQALLPQLEVLEGEFTGKIKFLKYNTSSGRRLAIREKILGLPTIAIYNNGVKVDEVTKDDATIENIKAMIMRNM